MPTQARVPCPDCDGAELTVYVALKADAAGKTYAVGANCYAAQWAEVYPDEPCPIEVPEATDD